MKVVAEGVEDAATMAVLAGMGCDMIQGWHVARPMPVEQLSRFLADDTVPRVDSFPSLAGVARL